MTLDWAEAAARHFDAPRRLWATPGKLAQHLDPCIRQTRALDLIDAHLVTLFDQEDGRLLLSMPPQEGKSQRVSRWFPLWALTQNPELRIAIRALRAQRRPQVGSRDPRRPRRPARVARRLSRRSG